MGLCGAMADVFGDIDLPRRAPAVDASVIVEPKKAEWRQGELVVRVSADESVTIGLATGGLIDLSPMAALELVDMVSNAIVWLDRRIAQEDARADS